MKKSLLNLEDPQSTRCLIFYPTLRTEVEQAFWAKFCAQLRARGYEPVVVSFLRSSDNHCIDTERIYIPTWRVIERTPGFEGYGDENSELLRTFLESPLCRAGLESLLEMASSTYAYTKGLTLADIPRDSPRYADFRRSGLVYVHYLLTVIERLTPALLVVNNDTHPLHLLARLCGEVLGVPIVHSERSPTVNQWFEPNGYYRDSKIASFLADGRWRQAGGHEQRGQQLVEQMNAAPAGHRATEAQRLTFEKSGSRLRIFLPLDHALATGWSLPSHPLRLRNYPVLSTPEVAINFFADLADKLGAELWVKAHPSENTGATFIRRAQHDPRVNFIVGRFEEALAKADLVICFLTKTAFTALALGKTVVTVGPNMAAVSGLTYDCNSEQNLEELVREALTRGPKSDQQELVARFLGFLDENYFVANDMMNDGAKFLLERHFPPLQIPVDYTLRTTAIALSALDPLACEAPDFDRQNLLFGPFGRRQERRIEEVDLVERLFEQGIVPTKGARPVMFDVGACVGGAHQWFANQGWKVHAFEPNPPMHARIVNSLAPDVTLNMLAVSDKSGEKVDFFTSEESIGISSMLAFRETHKPTATVETIRLDDYCVAQDVDHIDFLKVDTEGYDLFVLKSLNWKSHAPSVVVCEFEDKKTRLLGYAFSDIVSFLADHGYQIFVSEWHPITRYGAGEHRWRAMHHWPCDLFDTNAWGNLIAFKTPIMLAEMHQAVRFAVGKDFTDRANEGKLRNPAVVPRQTIIYGKVSPLNYGGYRLVPPPANRSWIGIKCELQVFANEKIKAEITFYCASSAKLRLFIGRVGQTPIESVKQFVMAEAGLNHFEVEAEFKHDHAGLIIQVGAAGDAPVRLGGLDCKIAKTGLALNTAAMPAPAKHERIGPMLVYYPPLDSDTALIDTMARAAWFLSFVDVRRIVIPITDPLLANKGWCVPKGMDPAVAVRFDALMDKIEFAVCADASAARPFLDESDGVLCWRSNDCADLFESKKANVEWLKGKRLWRVDPNSDRNEGAQYIEVGFQNMAGYEGIIARNQARFDAFASKIGKRNRAYIVATGPSAVRYRTLNKQDAFGVVCNSVILDDELMETLNPQLLVFADPIFHFGPSEYAAVFRQKVREAADKHDFTIAIPLKYHDIFLDQFPELESRMIAVPFTVRPDFNFDLSAQFGVKVTANILTFLMLPLAASFADEIEILGCDGRPLNENIYFWSHNSNTQINDKMENIRVVHPGFFAIDYNDYYLKHCALLAQLLSEGEAQGRRFVCMSHSHIPSLAARMARDSLPPASNSFLPKRPRVLVIDSTKIGSLTATGQVKKAFLRGWPPEKVMQISPTGDGGTAYHWPLIGRGGGRLNGDDDLFTKVRIFSPDVIYYRPVEHRPELDETAWKLLNRFDLPLVTHIMDDWPAMVAEHDPERAMRLDAGLRELFKRSHTALSISQRMSDAFAPRYGVNFTPLANGIDPAGSAQVLEAAKTVKVGRREVVLRYTGALAANMTLNAIADVAHVVDSLQGELPVRFEVYTMAPWRSGFEAATVGLTGVSVLDSVPDEQYPTLLAEADILVLGYNFCRSTLNYIGYSMPNKLPEYMASGAAVLAYGPRETAVMELLIANDLAVCVNNPDRDALRDAIRGLAVDTNARDTLATRARKWVVSHRDINRIADEFSGILTAAADSVCRQHASLARKDCAGVELPQPFALVGHFAREQHAHYDETNCIAQMVTAGLAGKVMIDVGAHSGTALASFLDMGWRIFAFEPDDKNRAKLLERLATHKNKQLVSLDSRCISNKSQKGVSFFTSEQSTGISGLSAFHETHHESQKVDITTLTEFFEDKPLPEVDFLKIDTEGHDLFVLQGFPWERGKPAVIECEFEDTKTVPLGYTFHDLARFLVDKGYTVYVSEWHPIIRYGIRHDWRQLMRYPCELADQKGWGNLLAFRDPIDEQALIAAVKKVLKVGDGDRVQKPAAQPKAAVPAQSAVALSVSGANLGFRFEPGEHFASIAPNQWRFTDAGAKQKLWLATMDSPGPTAGRSCVGSLRVMADRAMMLNVSLGRHGESEYEGTSKRIALAPGLPQIVKLKRQFKFDHSALKLQIEVLDLPGGGSATLTIDSWRISECLASVRERIGVDNLNLVTANRLFREGDFGSALAIYLALSQQHPLQMYRDNAVMAARRAGMTWVEDADQLA